jgi:hypothetical protein
VRSQSGPQGLRESDTFDHCIAECVESSPCEQIRSQTGCYQRCSEENCWYRTGSALWRACQNSAEMHACLEQTQCYDPPPDDQVLTNVTPIDGAYDQCERRCGGYLEGDT